MKLENKIAIVTGVSRGIGLTTVQTLLDKGMKVAGWGRTNPDVQHSNFEFVECDVRRADSVQIAYQHTVEHFGGQISVLVNNAGLGRSASLEEQSLDEWHLMFDTNVHGLFYCTKLVVPGMKQQGEGHIINISSIAGTTGIEQMSAYCATKHAVRGISHSLYKEVRDYGVKVTCMYPGSVQTNFFDNIDSVTVNDNMMRPEDIASTIVHCLESHANYHHVDIEVRPLMPKGRKQV